MDGPLLVLTLLTALGCGLIGGVFFAFSSFVMPALRRLPSHEGIAAMRSINVLAVTPAFMTALFGTAAACVALVVWVLFASDGSSPAQAIAGAAVYLAGVVVVTGARNVPLNERLAAAKPTDAGSAALWDEYLGRWTAGKRSLPTRSMGPAPNRQGALPVATRHLRRPAVDQGESPI